jgi:uncharacterized protein (DUF488 family)
MTLLGIGYEGLALDAFISRVRLHSIEVVVDVRLNAISRKRGFSKKTLSAALEAAGIEYLHRPALGNERDNREGYAETASARGILARNRFRQVLSTADSTATLNEVAKLALAKRVAVFCFEADERHCHREQVIEAVSALLEHDLIQI